MSNVDTGIGMRMLNLKLPDKRARRRLKRHVMDVV
jgi:hypothetical protein